MVDSSPFKPKDPVVEQVCSKWDEIVNRMLEVYNTAFFEKIKKVDEVKRAVTEKATAERAAQVEAAAEKGAREKEVPRASNLCSACPGPNAKAK